MITAEQFTNRLRTLGPWPRSRKVAVAVSGGADSLCLAWLLRHWGQPTALVVDHCLRPGSAAESKEAATRLARLGIPAHILTLRELAPGPGLAERARTARYAALTQQAAGLGLSDLLLGHHARDQAETVLMRGQAGSGPAGQAGMAAISVRGGLRLVRPLLGIMPEALRATLRSAGVAWVEDPSNTNPAALRNRLRAGLAEDAAATAHLLVQAAHFGLQRAKRETGVANTLARRATLFPEGYALLTPGPIDLDCLAALIRMVGGQVHAPASAAMARLATAKGLRCTLGGVRMLESGRLGPGTLLVREAAVLSPPVPAVNGATWDGRFQLSAPAALPEDATLGALGADAARLRHLSDLPQAILMTLPALRVGRVLAAVPHLPAFSQTAKLPEYFTGWTNIRFKLTLQPSSPAAGAAWVGDAQAARTHHVQD